jgi:hypothetical protein
MIAQVTVYIELVLSCNELDIRVMVEFTAGTHIDTAEWSLRPYTWT